VTCSAVHSVKCSDAVTAVQRSDVPELRVAAGGRAAGQAAAAAAAAGRAALQVLAHRAGARVLEGGPLPEV
jgi:hypothetical protein